MARTVMALYDDLSDAEKVVGDLMEHGYERNVISLLANDVHHDFGRYQREQQDEQRHAEGMAKDAAVGAAVGALAGLAVGLAGVTLPAVGAAMAAGPLVDTLAGAGVGAAGGGLLGALTDQGVDEENAGLCFEGVRRGGTFVVLQTSDTTSHPALLIMEQHRPVDLQERASQWRQRGWNGFSASERPLTAEEVDHERALNRESRRAAPEEVVTVPVVEEQVSVGKEAVQRRGVRVHSRVIEVPTEKTVRLREEHVTVTRRPADRPAGEAEREALARGTWEIPTTAEVPVVTKQARVVEEVVIGKEAAERTETVHETVRRTDVETDSAVPTQADEADLGAVPRS